LWNYTTMVQANKMYRSTGNIPAIGINLRRGLFHKNIFRETTLNC